MTALYVAGMLAVAVKQCPCGASGACKVRVHGYRVRKHGPGFRLVILVCEEHGCVFTVYPLGWFPFGRRPLPRTRKELLQVLLGDVEETFFGRLQRMQSEPWSTMEGYRRTVRRQFERAANFVGLTATSKSNAVLEALSVDLIKLVEVQRGYARATRWHERAELIAALLGEMKLADGDPESRLLQRLQHVGYVTGNVGRVWWVEADSGGLYPVFPEGNR